MEDSTIGKHPAAWVFDPEKTGAEVIIPDHTMTDDENPEWMEEMFQNARPDREVLTEIYGKEATERFLKDHKPLTADSTP